MSQAEREKYSVPGNFDRDWGRDNLTRTRNRQAKEGSEAKALEGHRIGEMNNFRETT